MLQFYQRPKVHLVWRIYNKGTYGEKSELLAVYGKLAGAKKALKRFRDMNKLEAPMFGITSWPLK